MKPVSGNRDDRLAISVLPLFRHGLNLGKIRSPCPLHLLNKVLATNALLYDLIVVTAALGTLHFGTASFHLLKIQDDDPDNLAMIVKYRILLSTLQLEVDFSTYK